MVQYCRLQNARQHRNDTVSTPYSLFDYIIDTIDRHGVEILSISCRFFCLHSRHRKNDRHRTRVKFESKFYPFFHVNIVDIAMLIDIDSIDIVS